TASGPPRAALALPPPLLRRTRRTVAAPSTNTAAPRTRSRLDRFCMTSPGLSGLFDGTGGFGVDGDARRVEDPAEPQRAADRVRCRRGQRVERVAHPGLGPDGHDVA